MVQFVALQLAVALCSSALLLRRAEGAFILVGNSTSPDNSWTNFVDYTAWMKENPLYIGDICGTPLCHCVTVHVTVCVTMRLSVCSCACVWEGGPGSPCVTVAVVLVLLRYYCRYVTVGAFLGIPHSCMLCRLVWRATQQHAETLR